VHAPVRHPRPALLSLGALDFGIIVDGTLIMVESVVRRLSTGRQSPAEADNITAIRQAVLQVERPIIFSLLILVAAYIPMFTLERVERPPFHSMAFTVCPRWWFAAVYSDAGAGALQPLLSAPAAAPGATR